MMFGDIRYIYIYIYVCVCVCVCVCVHVRVHACVCVILYLGSSTEGKVTLGSCVFVVTLFFFYHS